MNNHSHDQFPDVGATIEESSAANQELPSVSERISTETGAARPSVATDFTMENDANRLLQPVVTGQAEAPNRSSKKWLIGLGVVGMLGLAVGAALLVSQYLASQQYQQALVILTDGQEGFARHYSQSSKFSDDFEKVSEEECHQLDDLIKTNQATIKRLVEHRAIANDQRAKGRLEDLERAFNKNIERSQTLSEVGCVGAKFLQKVKTQNLVLADETVDHSKRIKTAEQSVEQFRQLAKALKSELNQKFYQSAADQMAAIIQIDADSPGRKLTNADFQIINQYIKQMRKNQAKWLSDRASLRNKPDWTVAPLNDLKDYLQKNSQTIN